MLLFNAAGFLLVYAPACGCRRCCRSIRRSSPRSPPDLAFNTAVSFATNTNWQNYGGESTLSYLTQMVGADDAELRLGGDRHRACRSR